MTTNAYDRDGVHVGWHSQTFNREGKPVRVFVPRREQDIEEDRRARNGDAPRGFSR